VVFENTLLRRIFGPKRDEVTGEWRQLHNEELHYTTVLNYNIRKQAGQKENTGNVLNNVMF
jgi:hypothetical protein